MVGRTTRFDTKNFIILLLVGIIGIVVGTLFEFIHKVELISTTTSLVATYPLLSETPTLITPLPSRVTPTFGDVSKEIAFLHQEVINLDNKISTLTDKGEIDSLLTDIQGLNVRLTALEQTIADSPEEAYSIILLRRDIDNIQINSQKESELTQQKIDNINDFVKSIAGVMVSTLLTLAGLTVSVFFTVIKPNIVNRSYRTDDNKTSNSFPDRNRQYVRVLYYPRKRKRTTKLLMSPKASIAKK